MCRESEDRSDDAEYTERHHEEADRVVVPGSGEVTARDRSRSTRQPACRLHPAESVSRHQNVERESADDRQHNCRHDAAHCEVGEPSHPVGIFDSELPVHCPSVVAAISALAIAEPYAQPGRHHGVRVRVDQPGHRIRRGPGAIDMADDRVPVRDLLRRDGRRRPGWSPLLREHRGHEGGDDGEDDLERVVGAVGLALFEVVAFGRHRVGHVRHTDHCLVPSSGVGVQGGGLHLDGDDAELFGMLDRRGRLAIGSVGGPGRPEQDGLVRPGERTVEPVQERDWGIGPLGRWEVVVTGALVAQGLVDDDEVRRLGDRCDRPRGGDADQQLTARYGELFGQEHRERGADCAADDTDLGAAEIEDPQGRVVAGPPRMLDRGAGGCEVADDVAVGVKQAHFRNRDVRPVALASPFAQQVLGVEYRGFIVRLGCTQRGFFE